MGKAVERVALESTVVNCPHGIVAHILHDPFGLLTLPYRARLYRMGSRFQERWENRQAHEPELAAIL
ncbi:MAG: hypothetical protein KF814_12760 [Nitrospiraceae bacterium]|nr:hypothetical protein [Nitrospiraceae bacterium]